MSFVSLVATLSNSWSTFVEFKGSLEEIVEIVYLKIITTFFSRNSSFLRKKNVNNKMKNIRYAIKNNFQNLLHKFVIIPLRNLVQLAPGPPCHRPCRLCCRLDFEDSSIRVGLDLREPLGQTVERGLTRHVVHQHDCVRRTVVGLRDRAETLLTRSVPDLKLQYIFVMNKLKNFQNCRLLLDHRRK